MNDHITPADGPKSEPASLGAGAGPQAPAPDLAAASGGEQPATSPTEAPPDAATSAESAAQVADLAADRGGEQPAPSVDVPPPDAMPPPEAAPAPIVAETAEPPVERPVPAAPAAAAASTSPATEASVTRKIQILGPFNSGSSFAEHLFQTNNLDLTGIDFQQTLFKHYPPALVLRLVDQLGLPCDNVLFVAPVRHPGVWIDAMERNRYELVYDNFDAPCRLNTAAARNFYKTYDEHLMEAGLTAAEIDAYFSFDNIFDFWERSYRGYIELGKHVPLSIVRYEDMLTDTPAIILGLRERMGLPRPESVIIPMRPSKDHGDALSFVHARRKLLRQRADPDSIPHAALVKERIGHDLLDALHYL